MLVEGIEGMPLVGGRDGERARGYLFCLYIQYTGNSRYEHANSGTGTGECMLSMVMDLCVYRAGDACNGSRLYSSSLI